MFNYTMSKRIKTLKLKMEESVEKLNHLLDNNGSEYEIANAEALVKNFTELYERYKDKTD
jgi:hypothetical protein